MQEATPANEREETSPGVEEAVTGGAAVAWLVDGGSGRCCGGSNGGERDLFSVAFSSVFSLFFGFGFFVFGLFLLSHSLLLVLSLLPLSSGLSLFLSGLLPPPRFSSVSSVFIGEEKTVPFASAPWE